MSRPAEKIRVCYGRPQSLEVLEGSPQLARDLFSMLLASESVPARMEVVDWYSADKVMVYRSADACDSCPDPKWCRFE